MISLKKLFGNRRLEKPIENLGKISDADSLTVDEIRVLNQLKTFVIALPPRLENLNTVDPSRSDRVFVRNRDETKRVISGIGDLWGRAMELDEQVIVALVTEEDMELKELKELLNKYDVLRGKEGQEVIRKNIQEHKIGRRILVRLVRGERAEEGHRCKEIARGIEKLKRYANDPLVDEAIRTQLRELAEGLVKIIEDHINETEWLLQLVRENEQVELSEDHFEKLINHLGGK